MLGSGFFVAPAVIKNGAVCFKPLRWTLRRWRALSRCPLDVPGWLQPTFGDHGVVQRSERCSGESSDEHRTAEIADSRAEHRVNAAEQADLGMDSDEHLPTESLAESRGKLDCSANRANHPRRVDDELPREPEDSDWQDHDCYRAPQMSIHKEFAELMLHSIEKVHK